MLRQFAKLVPLDNYLSPTGNHFAGRSLSHEACPSQGPARMRERDVEVAVTIARHALLLFLLTQPAQAQTQPQAQDRIEIDTNLFCDTQRQVEQFLSHFSSNGQNAEAAIATVNEEHQMTDACVFATAAYQRAGQVTTVHNAAAVFNVLRVVVVAVYTVNSFEQSMPTEFFTLIPRDDDASTVGQRE